jgi:tartrate dehydratase beta subunit/fumarate hydratase class I family protein
MASGKRAYIGAVACPRDWKLGTKVMIDGVEYTCEDRYNKDLSDRIDIFQGYGIQSHEVAVNYGKQVKLVYIIK